MFNHFPRATGKCLGRGFLDICYKIFQFSLFGSQCLSGFFSRPPTVCLDADFSLWVIHCFMSLHDYLLIIIIIFFSLHSLLLLGVIGENVLLIHPFSLVLNSKAFL